MTAGREGKRAINGLRRRRPRRGGGEDNPPPVTYDSLLETLASAVGPLALELNERHSRRAAHLVHLLTLSRLTFDGLSELRESFLWLTRVPGADPEIAALCRQAADKIVGGVESLLVDTHPRVLDEARYLMEIEFLFYEFAREPSQVPVWRDLSARERNQRFGFGALRRREERARNVPADHVLADRQEYSVHSSSVHPCPSSETADVGLDAASGIFHDASDLLQHAARTWAAALDAFESTMSDREAEADEMPPRLDAVTGAMGLIDEQRMAMGWTRARPDWLPISEDVLPTPPVDESPRTDL
jgi:hypothetical protein